MQKHGKRVIINSVFVFVIMKAFTKSDSQNILCDIDIWNQLPRVHGNDSFAVSITKGDLTMSPTSAFPQSESSLNLKTMLI